MPVGISPQINHYLCRAIDATSAYSKSKLFLYTKLGPIIVISSILPDQIVKMSDSLIHMQGKLKTAQHLGNLHINDFIFISRPNESMGLYKLSKKQQEIVDRETLAGAERGKGIKSVLANYSDKMMEEGKRML